MASLEAGPCNAELAITIDIQHVTAVASLQGIGRLPVPGDAHEKVVTSLLVDHTGTLWAGTDSGLSRFDPNTDGFGGYRTSSDAMSQYHSIAEDSHGALWLATWHDGLQRFDPATGQFTIYRHDPAGGGLSSNWVNWVLVDHSGGVWAGTQNGLDRFDLRSGTFVVYGEHEGLPNSAVTGILEDDHGNLWVSTNNGLSRFNPRKHSRTSMCPTGFQPTSSTVMGQPTKALPERCSSARMVD